MIEYGMKQCHFVLNTHKPNSLIHHSKYLQQNRSYNNNNMSNSVVIASIARTPIASFCVRKRFGSPILASRLIFVSQYAFLFKISPYVKTGKFFGPERLGIGVGEFFEFGEFLLRSITFCSQWLFFVSRRQSRGHLPELEWRICTFRNASWAMW